MASAIFTFDDSEFFMISRFLQNVERHPENACLLCYNEQTTKELKYIQIYQDMERIKTQLEFLKPGDILLSCFETSSYAITLMLTCFYMNVIWVPIETDLSSAGATRLIELIKPRMFISEQDTKIDKNSLTILGKTFCYSKYESAAFCNQQPIRYIMMTSGTTQSFRKFVKVPDSCISINIESITRVLQRGTNQDRINSILLSPLTFDPSR
jgi:acyl-CoA synthetase (AMP-forming)/AMP-acid ligase II